MNDSNKPAKPTKQEMVEKYNKVNDMHTTSNCAFCKQSGVKCLCHAVFTDTKSNEELEWKPQNFWQHNPKKIFFAVKELKLNYSLDGECGFGCDSQHCVDFFYYKECSDTSKKEIKWGNSKSKIVTLEFDNEVLSADRPFYVTKNPLGDFVVNNDVRLANKEVLFLYRAFNFLIMNKFEGIPVTAYAIGVSECHGTEIGVQADTAINLVKHKIVQAEAFILPEYRIDADLTIGLAQEKHAFNTTPDIEKSIFMDYSKQAWKLEFKGTLEETINNGTPTKLELNIVELSRLGGKGFFGLLAQFNDFLNNFNFPGIKIGPFTIDLKPPLIVVKGVAELKYDQGKKLFIDRTDSSIDFKPLIGVEIGFDIIEALLTNFPPIAKAYTRYKKSVTKITRNKSKSKSKLKLTTKAERAEELRNKLLNKIKSEEAGNEGFWGSLFPSFSLMVYADITLTVTAEGGGTLTSANIDDPYDRIFSEMKTKAELALEAGISFKAEVFIFSGAFDVSLKVATALEITFKERLNKTCFEIKHTGVYLTYKVEISYSIQGKENESVAERGDIYENTMSKNNANKPIMLVSERKLYPWTPSEPSKPTYTVTSTSVRG